MLWPNCVVLHSLYLYSKYLHEQAKPGVLSCLVKEMEIISEPIMVPPGAFRFPANPGSQLRHHTSAHHSEWLPRLTFQSAGARFRKSEMARRYWEYKPPGVRNLSLGPA
jgi:hypothetical protein